MLEGFSIDFLFVLTDEFFGADFMGLDLREVPPFESEVWRATHLQHPFPFLSISILLPRSSVRDESWESNGTFRFP